MQWNRTAIVRPYWAYNYVMAQQAFCSRRYVSLPHLNKAVELTKVLSKAIFFDGYLPAAKLPVRMERMVKNTSQLNQFYSSCPNGCPERHLFQRNEGDMNLFASHQPEAKQLLPPSFLVPAVIDALKQSPKYRSLVHQVPGEADAFCAQHLATHGGIVLTSDSDLLVHDLAGSRVVFFRDIHVADGNSSWQCLLYDPRAICQRLGVPPEETRRLGYEVDRSYHATVSQIVRNCDGPVANEKDFEEFCQQYLHHETSPVPTIADGKALPLKRLDPRLSELVLQLGNKEMDGQDARMFLPVLVESPMRGSAWEPSTPIRQLAYTIFRWMVPGQTSSVQEYRRVQTQQQKGRSVGLLDKESARTAIEDLISTMMQMKTLTHDIPVSFWLILCLVLDIQECQQKEKRSHALYMIEQLRSVSEGISNNKVSWDLIQLTAQLQASCYSLRMLRQVLSLCSDTAEKELPQEALDLQKMVVEVPRLDDFPDIPRTTGFLGKLRQGEVREILAKFVTSINQEASAPSGKSPNVTKKRKKERDQSDPTSKRAATQTAPTRGNMFSLLSDE